MSGIFRVFRFGVFMVVGLRSHLGVDDDLQVHAVLLLQPLDGGQRDPQVVGVEDLELGDGLELVHVGLRDLSYLQEPHAVLVLDQGPALQSGTGSARKPEQQREDELLP